MKTVLHLMVAVSALATAQFCTVPAATLYVDVNSTNATAPYTNWATAAIVIQDAVDAAAVGDEIMVADGVYATGGRQGNRVAVNKPLTLRSLKGPEFTIIQGANPLFDEEGTQTNETMRCVYLANGASLSGFTLTNGAAGNGGGVYGESEAAVVANCVLTGNSTRCGGGGASGCTLNNCTLTGNWANSGTGACLGQAGGAVYCTLNSCTLTGNSASVGGAFGCTLNNCTLANNMGGWGGGAGYSTLNNCTLTGNSAELGGGAYGGTLNNCTLTGNSAHEEGGGVYGGTLNNCIVYYNTAGRGANYSGDYPDLTFNYCCTTPLPTNGVSNITGPPLFMDLTEGDFRLSEDSPCIDAGANLALLNIGYAYEPTDILGNTRFIDGNGDGKVAWDIGAYEFNSFKPPRFKIQPQLTPDGWKLNITGEPNKWMRLQRSGDFKNWEDIWFGWMGPESVKEINDRQSYEEGQGAMFYRAVVP